jgi:hypothetical protein
MRAAARSQARSREGARGSVAAAAASRAGLPSLAAGARASGPAATGAEQLPAARWPSGPSRGADAVLGGTVLGGLPPPPRGAAPAAGLRLAPLTPPGGKGTAAAGGGEVDEEDDDAEGFIQDLGDDGEGLGDSEVGGRARGCEGAGLRWRPC